MAPSKQTTVMPLASPPTTAWIGNVSQPATSHALSRLRRNNAHLALVTGRDGSVVAIVALEDLVEDLVGTVRDGTHRV